MARGMVATDASPTATAQPARAFPERRMLLLDVGLTKSGGWYRAADEPDDGDEGQDVWKRLEEDGSGLGVDGELEGKCTREAEEQSGRERAERSPAAEDQCGEPDEPLAFSHVLVERVHEPDREIRTAERCQHA